MAKPPHKKPNSPNRAQAKDSSELDTFFDDFFENNQPHQLDDTANPEDQQRQWISDQLMWETTLGMREDETINRAITPGDEVEQPSPAESQTPAHKRELSERERQLLRTQVIKPAAAPKPAAPKQAEPKAAARKALPTRPATAAKPAAVTTSKAPVSPVKPAASAARIQSGTQPQAGRKPSPPKPAPVTQPNAKSAAPKPAQSKPSTAARRTSAQPATSPVKRPAPAAVQAKAHTAAPPTHTQTQPVALRESDLVAQETIDFDAAERDGKYFTLARKTASMAVIALISFLIGYFTGNSGTDSTAAKDNAAEIAQLEKSIAEKAAKTVAKKTQPPKKEASKKSPSKPAESASVASAPEAQATQEPPADNAAVFEGREIVVEQFDSTKTQTKATTGQTAQGTGADPFNNLGQANSLDTSQETANFLPKSQNAQENEALATHTPTQTAEPLQNPTTSTDTVAQNNLQNLLDQSLKAFQDRQWQTVIELSNQILVIDPGVVTALTNRAAANTELGNYVQALADCNLAIKIEPGNALANNNRGYVYEKMGDWQNAIADYQTACDLGIELSCKEAQRLRETPPPT